MDTTTDPTLKKSLSVNVRRLTGDNFRIQFDPEETTVLQLKERLAVQAEIPVGEQRLVLSGRTLEDSNYLAFYDVKDESTIHLVIRTANRAQTHASQPIAPTTTPAPSNPFGLGGNPAGIGGMDRMQQQLFSNPDQLGQLMNSPIMTALTSNPEIMRTMMLANPQVREMIERNPEMGHIINDPAFLRQSVEMARNPELMRAAMRSNDRALSNIEAIPGGFNHLRRLYEQVGEPMSSLGRPANPSTDAVNSEFARRLNVQDVTHGEINTAALPNPWTPAPSQPTSTTSGALNGNPLAGFGALNAGGIAPPPFNPFLMNALQAQRQQLNLTANPMGQPGDGRTAMNPDFAQSMMQLQHLLRNGAGGGGIGATPMVPGAQNPFMQLLQQQMSQASPVSATPTEPPEVRFRVELASLEEMGFGSQAANIRALLATNGNVQAAVDYLLRTNV